MYLVHAGKNVGTDRFAGTVLLDPIEHHLKPDWPKLDLCLWNLLDWPN